MRHRDAAQSQSAIGRKTVRTIWALPLLAAGAACAGLLLTTTSSLAVGRLEPSAPLVSPLPTPSLPALPTPTLPAVTPPLTTPSAPPVTPPAVPTPPAVATPSLPVSLSPAPATPSVPPLSSSPTPSATPVSAGAPAGGTSAGGGGGSGGGPGHGVKVPFTSLVIASPLDAALLAAVAVLPLLLAIWLLTFGRTWTEARRSREAHIRLAIASDLGLRPREVVSVSTKALFKLREEAAFDELTGVLRRAAGISALDREIARARRQKSPLSIAFLDVDGLKQANMVVNHHAPPTTSQSVFPVADQRLPFTSVWILRGSCGGNRRMPLTGESERVLEQSGHSTTVTPLSVNRLRSMETTIRENVHLGDVLVCTGSFAISTVFVVFCCSFP